MEIKIKNFIFVLSLILSQFDLAISIKVSKNSSMMTGGQNKYYQLFAGFTFAIAGKAQDVTAFNQCVPKSWQTVDESPVNDSEPTPSKETLTKVIDGIENLVNFVCTFKDYGKSIVGLFEKIGFKAVSTIKKFLNKETITNLTALINCATTLKDLKAGIVEVINGVKAKVALIQRIAAQDYTALAELLVGLICNFSLFREAFKYLFSSFDEKQQLPKFSLVGKFIGTAFRALSV